MKIFLYLLFAVVTTSAIAQTQPSSTINVEGHGADKPKRHKGTLYIAWGYNRDFYTNSDIHFVNNSPDAKNGPYNFVLQGATAHDHSSIGEITHVALSIPQYNYRIGYYFNDKHDFGLEVNFDHTKYIVDNNHVVHLKGSIAGKSYDQDTLLVPQFVQFRHTNGGNYLMLNVMKRWKLLPDKSGRNGLAVVGKVGVGPVIPKTIVTLFDELQDNHFHIAGWVTGADATIRYDFLNYFFLEGSNKLAFASYTDALTVGDGRAYHTFWTYELILTAGLRIDL